MASDEATPRACALLCPAGSDAHWYLLARRRRLLAGDGFVRNPYGCGSHPLAALRRHKRSSYASQDLWGRHG